MGDLDESRGPRETSVEKPMGFFSDSGGFLYQLPSITIPVTDDSLFKRAPPGTKNSLAANFYGTALGKPLDQQFGSFWSPSEAPELLQDSSAQSAQTQQKAVFLRKSGSCSEISCFLKPCRYLRNLKKLISHKIFDRSLTIFRIYL